MIETGILFDGIKVVEVATGLLFLANCYVPLALVVAVMKMLVWISGWIALCLGLLADAWLIVMMVEQLSG